MSLTIEQFEQWALSHNYNKDRYGHFTKEVEMVHKVTGEKSIRTIRYKVQAISIRKEIKVHIEAGPYSKASNSWVRVKGAYLKDLTINKYNQLQGLTR